MTNTRTNDVAKQEYEIVATNRIEFVIGAQRVEVTLTYAAWGEQPYNLYGTSYGEDFNKSYTNKLLAENQFHEYARKAKEEINSLLQHV